MTTSMYAITLVLINSVLVGVLTMHRYRRSLLVPILLLALAVPGLAWCSGSLFRLPVTAEIFVWIRGYGILLVLISALLLEIVVRFMRGESGEKTRSAVSLLGGSLWGLRGVSGSALVAGSLFLWAVPAQSGLEQIFAVTPLGLVVGIAVFLNALAVLYVLENTYRFAAEYQRRIARLCLISLGSIAIFLIVFAIRLLLYRAITRTYIDTAAVVLGVCVPVLYLGLMRYRLGSEQISVSRHTVYSSVTLLMVGAVLLALSGAIAAGKWLGIAAGTFEMYLVIFAVAFFGVLVVSSGTMRIRVMQFINTHVYTHKYDYREQFFRLHRTYMSGADIEGSVTELIENMKYAVAVEDAYVFLAGGQDGVFTMHENQESATPSSIRVNADHPFIAALRAAPHEIDFTARPQEKLELEVFATLPAGVAQLSVRALFPIRYMDELVGFLGIRQNTRAQFDTEDLDLIRVFTDSIGNVVFKQRMLRERIEHKQFESFTRVASFIIHDIKNQVATLTLLLRNADRNIGNPAFQKSLIASVKDTSSNLQELVDRLSQSRERKREQPNPQHLDIVVKDAIDTTGVMVLDSVSVQSSYGAPEAAVVDHSALLYVFKNLVGNALEAMEHRGVLTIQTGPAANLPREVASRCGLAGHVLDGRTAYVVVSDTGRGMSEDFIKNRLFHPFSSTKDKGVGIGLYQCKTQVEKEGGIIRCFSQSGVGTTFCIVV